MKRLLFILVMVMPIVFVGCSGDDNDNQPDVITLRVSEKTLYFGDSTQIEAISNSKINYSSENEYHAVVSEKGMVKALFVGETNIKLSNGEDQKTFKVIVKPKNNLYPEPDVKFGDTKSSITAKFGVPGGESESSIIYTDYSNAAPYLMFSFDSSNKMELYSVHVKTFYASAIAQFLSERYMPLGEVTEDVLGFINGFNYDTATMLIALSMYNVSYLQVVYGKNTLNSQNALKKSIYDSANKFDELLKQLQ